MEKLRFNANSIVEVLGFGSVVAYVLLSYFYLGPQSFSNLQEALYMRAAGLITWAASMYLIIYWAEHVVTIGEKRWVATAILLSIAMSGILVLRLLGITLPTIFMVLAWVMNGMVCALLFGLWSHLLMQPARQAIMPNIVASFAVGGLLYLLVAHSHPIILWAGMPVLVLFSLLLRRTLSRSGWPKNPIPLEKSRVTLELSHYTSFSSGLTSLALCLCLQNTLVAGHGFAMVALPLTIIAISLCLLAVIGRIEGHYFTFVMAQRVSYPLVISGVLSTMTDCVPIQLAGFTVTAAAFTLYHVSNWSTLALLGSHYQVNPLYHLARGRGPLIFGGALGWAFGCVLEAIPGQVGIQWESIAMGILLVVLAIAVAVVPFGYDTLTVRSALDEPSDHKSGRARRPWKHTIEALSKEHGLTKREIDVFSLLAKGLNAESIAEKLIISEKTVKVHTYHVYQKLGVSSRQELIAYVDECHSKPLPPEEPVC